MPDPGELLASRLRAFSAENSMTGKGPLSVALVLTRRAASMDVPLEASDFLTPRGGQVAGLSGLNVQAILSEHGIFRILAEEGGRTSRGSIRRMEAYIELLNRLNRDNLLDFIAIEAWWVQRVKDHFSAEPLRLRLDATKSLRAIVADLIETAFERQRECPGTMVAGAVMQHLVGAKLDVVLPDHTVLHEGFSVADAPGKRKGDFIINDTVVHVTTAPAEALIRKCSDNLAENLRPLLITTESGVGGAKALAKNARINDRIDILDIEQFVTTNVYEWSIFNQANRSASVHELVDAYNRIIEACETDHSLMIGIG